MLSKKLLAEFIGTFTLIFVGVGAIAGTHMSPDGIGLVGVALAHGLAIGVMVSATAAVSGGHLNPAVTFGFLSARLISAREAAAYVIAQVAGASVAAVAVSAVTPTRFLSAAGFGIPEPARIASTTNAFVVETILTFLLMFVVFGAMVDRRAPKQLGSLFIGLTVVMGILIGGPISGAAMNPARHFGPALVFSHGLQWTWLYWLGPIAGAVAAAQLYGKFLEEK